MVAIAIIAILAALLLASLAQANSRPPVRVAGAMKDSWLLPGPCIAPITMKNCEKREIYKRTEIRRTSRIMLWVEENDPQGENIGSWVMKSGTAPNITDASLTDSPAVFHGNSTRSILTTATAKYASGWIRPPSLMRRAWILPNTATNQEGRRLRTMVCGWLKVMQACFSPCCPALARLRKRLDTSIEVLSARRNLRGFIINSQHLKFGFFERRRQ